MRAGLIAGAIGLGLISGLPIPPSAETYDWQRWFVEPIRSVQRVLLLPVAGLAWDLRVTQRFALFQVAAASRFRMRVEGLAGGQWQLLFRAADPEHREYAELLEYRRINGMWNPSAKPPAEYGRFASWFCDRVLADHPELTAVRMRQERVELEPGEVHDSGTYDFTVYRGRR